MTEREKREVIHSPRLALPCLSWLAQSTHTSAHSSAAGEHELWVQLMQFITELTAQLEHSQTEVMGGEAEGSPLSGLNTQILHLVSMWMQ